MTTITQHIFTARTFTRSTIAGAAIAFALAPVGASAFMRSVSDAELAGLDRIEDSGYIELYQSPDLDSIAFTSIYIEPVINIMNEREIYESNFRPHHVDELCEDYRAVLLEALAPTGLLVDEPSERTLIITPYITDIREYTEWTTGTFVAGSNPGRRIRGGAVMEMTWRAGPGGDMVLALRDGRQMEQVDPVRDREDRFSDARSVFDMWGTDLAGFFGLDPEVATN